MKAVGRPPVVSDPKVVSKLEQAFKDGYNVSQACMHAGISRESYYQNLRSNQEFADKMSYAQEWITLQAKSNMISAINKGDLKASKWWLETTNAQLVVGDDSGAMADYENDEQSFADIDAGYEAWQKMKVMRAKVTAEREAAAAKREIAQHAAA